MSFHRVGVFCLFLLYFVSFEREKKREIVTENREPVLPKRKCAQGERQRWRINWGNRCTERNILKPELIKTTINFSPAYPDSTN